MFNLTHQLHADDPEANGGAEPQPDGPEEQPEAPEEKSLTQADVDRIVAREKAKAAKSARAEVEAERKKQEMSEAERYKADLEERDKALEAARAEVREARQRAQLAPDVADVDYALFKVQQSGDKYVNEDGQVQLDAFLKDFPNLRSQPEPKPGPAPTNAGGGSARPADMNTFIRQKAGKQ